MVSNTSAFIEDLAQNYELILLNLNQFFLLIMGMFIFFVSIYSFLSLTSKYLNKNILRFTLIFCIFSCFRLLFFFLLFFQSCTLDLLSLKQDPSEAKMLPTAS